MLKGIVNGVEKDIVKVPMFDNGVEHDGWEIRDNQDRLIWGREDEFEGTDSIPIKGCGTPLTSVTIKGNGSQIGTPTPDAPIMPTFCDVRTANLISLPTVTATIDGLTVSSNAETMTISGNATTTLESNSAWKQFDFTLEAGEYTLSLGSPRAYQSGYAPRLHKYDDGSVICDYLVGGSIGSIAFTLSEKTHVYVAFYINNKQLSNDKWVFMLNLGSTALPYEPYGYKIPITCAGQTTPLYLGEVSTVRRIRKLVLDGTENWFINGGISTEDTAYLYTTVLASNAYMAGYSICSHFEYKNAYTILDENGFQLLSGYGGLRFRIMRTIAGTVADFKAWLASEYAAGHPVTVWYVLAETETGIVNEPLMKIGDYADTLTTTTPIPTTTGATDVTVDTKIPPSELTIKVHAKKIRYGFKIDKSQENSESAVIYTHDAVTMTPAVMDFTNDRFSYGSWENAWFVRDARPCALKLDGTVAYYLDPNDATKKLDGTASDIYYELLSTEPADWSTQWKQYYTKSGDDYTLNDQTEAPTFATNTYYKLTYNSSFTGNFMVEFPQVWFKRYEDSSYNYIEISNYKLSDDWKCYSHINKDGTLVDRIYLPMFKGVIKDSKLRSLPGQIPQGNTSAMTEVNAATALGSRWQIWDHSSVECLNDLLTLMSKSIDSQGRFGQGRSTGYNSTDTVTYGKLQSGTLIKKGKFYGYSATTKEVKVFGIEGFWANRWDRLQGMLLVNNVWKIKMTPPYNFTGTDFVTLSNAEVPSGEGYLSKVQTSEYGSIPASIANGSSTKYFKDYFYKTATSTRVALRGGRCDYGGRCGFRCVYVSDAASYSGWGVGASPVYK